MNGDPVFWAGLALLFIHEMDAVRHKEWRMFAVLNRLPDKTAADIFILAHFPLYIVVFYYLSYALPGVFFTFAVITDAFLILHLFLHISFRNHKANLFDSVFSQSIIFAAAITGIIHLVILLK